MTALKRTAPGFYETTDGLYQILFNNESGEWQLLAYDADFETWNWCQSYALLKDAKEGMKWCQNTARSFSR